MFSNQDAIALYKNLAGQAYRENQINLSHRAKQIKSEMEKLRQRMNDPEAEPRGIALFEY